MKAKYIYGLLGAIAVALAGCSADEVISINESDASISFNVVIANLTRANSYCNVNLPPHFYVWADYKNSENQTTLFYGGDKIIKVDESSYKGEYPRFWPSSGVQNMSFYAYVDAEDAAGNNTFTYIKDGHHKFVDFTVNQFVKDQKDLMYAINTNVSAPESGQSNKTVTLNFRHALSQICFKAQNQNPNIKITIHSLSLHGVQNKGTFTFPSASTADKFVHHTDEVDAEGRDLNRGVWVLNSDNAENQNQSYEISFTDADGNGGKVLTTPAKNATSFVSDNLTAPESSESGHTGFEKAMNLLPQTQIAATVTDSEPQTGAYITLNLSIVNTATSASGTGSDETNVSTAKDYYVPVNIDWKEGYRYIYTFKFHPCWDYANATTIEYDVTADDFNNEEVTPEEPETPAPDGASEIQITDDEGNPTGKYFAEMNLGASSPYESGLYFWWGDNTGFDPNGKVDAASYFSSTNNPIISSTDDSYPSKYIENYTGYLYDKDTKKLTKTVSSEKQRLKSDASVNPAINILGNGWRLPTMEELQWLFDQCTWTIDSSKSYYEVVQKATKRKMIVPIAGQYSNSGDFNKNKVRLWTSTNSSLSSESKIALKAYLLSYETGGEEDLFDSQRYTYGVPIRPIYDPELAKQQETQNN